MNGVAVIRYLLANHAPLTAVVPDGAEPQRISTDILGQGVVLPALELSGVSIVDLNIPNPGATRFVRERVAVEVHAEDVAELHSVMKLVRDACTDQSIETFGALTRIRVSLDGMGPQGISVTSFARARTQDLLVSYNEPA